MYMNEPFDNLVGIFRDNKQQDFKTKTTIRKSWDCILTIDHLVLKRNLDIFYTLDKIEQMKKYKNFYLIKYKTVTIHSSSLVKFLENGSI